MRFHRRPDPCNDAASQDSAFATKLRDVVGVYLDPPAHSMVLSVDEKSPIQSLPLA